MTVDDIILVSEI